ncbi:MAG: serine/threonine protein kinase [Deltaproteobacteria bacterium]|nr:serine/threonine protein kinase [Deltaproteobacteria bacterium]
MTPEGEEELTARIAYGDQAATILADPLATLRPSHDRLSTQEEAALEALLELAADERRGGVYETFEETLGTGAMGMVRVATQPGMGRKVAVKTLGPRHRDQVATLRLLQEAWITGSLEHPNIVPVYEIAIDKQKSPQVVLRRIEGLHWRDFLRDPQKITDLYGEQDRFEWNLRILMQVCSAIHFAHQRGIVHRDVKPENVMIGRFGDVYVMDWGIAVSTRQEDEGRIPVAWRVTEMAGTPAYMAPEMLDGEEPHVSPLTDVYLLGATLYELVARRAPHRGASLMDLVRSIVRSAPEFPPDAPPALVEICKRAMHPDPEERFPSAEAFRQAVQDFLRYKGSARLCFEATQKLTAFEAALLSFRADLPEDVVAELEARVSDVTVEQVVPKSHAERARIHDLFGACRFGFQQALVEGPDNPVARDGLERTVALMAQFELSQGNLSAAELLAMELKRPPPNLRRQLKRHQHHEEKKLREMEQLRREHDPNVGLRTRAMLALILGLAWTLSPLIAEHWLPGGRGMLITTALWTAAFIAAGAALALRTRRALGASALNRGLVGTLFLTLVGQLALNAGVAISGAAPESSQVMRLFLWSVATAMASVTLDRRLGWAATVYMVGYFAASAWPDAVYRIMSLCNLAFTVNALVIWWPRPHRR